MRGPSQPISKPKSLKALSALATFIISNHLEEFLRVSLQLLRELDVPLLRPLTDKEAEELSNKSNHELLVAIAAGDPEPHIQTAIERWKASQFPKVRRNEIVVEDVMRIGQVRKLAFMKFIPAFTSDTHEIIAIVKDIDEYIFEYTTTTLHTFVGIIDERINGHLLRLEESEQLYKKAETIAHIGNWKWDVAQNKVHWTDELYRIYGLEPQSIDINFEVYLSFTHPDDRDMITTYVTHSLQTKEPYSFYHRIIVDDGKEKMLHSRGEVVLDQQGKVSQLIGSAQDVTILKEAEKKLLEYQHILLQQTLALQQSNESLEEFAYVTSHDLKEPLRKISIFIDRLEDLRKKCSPAEREYLNKIASSVVRMRNMIDDLLALSLISAKKEPEKYSLKKLLNDALQNHEAKIEETKAKVSATELPVATVIPSQFFQLFQNLLGNSLKFSRSNVLPVITITHEYLAPSAVTSYNISPSEKYLAIYFSDNGIGFDNAFVEKIFGVFQRLHNKHEYDGTGIGLAICRKIVQNHGGTIIASGVVGEGASFTVIIPV